MPIVWLPSHPNGGSNAPKAPLKASHMPQNGPPTLASSHQQTPPLSVSQQLQSCPEPPLAHRHAKQETIAAAGEMIAALPTPAMDLVHVHGYNGKPLCIVPACCCIMVLWLLQIMLAPTNSKAFLA